MIWPKKEEVNKIREEYPEGTIIELNYMDDVSAPPKGTRGVVTSVDDIGNIHLLWEVPCGLALIPSKDSFKKVGFNPSLLDVPCKELKKYFRQKVTGNEM